ncbi:MAG TPA: hypothetical protein VFD03_01980 [Clostridia bacterium]|nr:hypothetical protein [Clostridia bacterium]
MSENKSIEVLIPGGSVVFAPSGIFTNDDKKAVPYDAKVRLNVGGSSFKIKIPVFLEILKVCNDPKNLDIIRKLE